MSLHLVFGGDVMLGRLAGETMLREGADYPLGALAPLLRSADLAIANLECAICEPAERWHGADKAYYFRAPPVAGEALRDAGIGLVSLANNHILDYDVQGLLETVRILDAQGIAHAGAGADLAAALAPLRAEGVRWPILSLHWGPNMVSEPSVRQRRLARAAIEVGWKIIYGHSAHVFQGVELYEGCPILYAAGDLVDDYAVDPAFRNDHQLLFEL